MLILVTEISKKIKLFDILFLTVLVIRAVVSSNKENFIYFYRKNFDISWKEVYLKILDKRLDSNLRTFNFKVINDAISINLKFKKQEYEKCYLCKKRKETRKHLFVECQKTRNLFSLIKNDLNEEIQTLSEELIFYHHNLNEFEDLKNISRFKLAI